MNIAYRQRIESALTETRMLLAKELAYSVDLQKPDQVAFYNQHIAKLQNYLDTDTCVIHGITY